MNNCLNVPGELLEAMLTMAWQHMEPKYLKKFSETDWLSPRQAGPTWQVLVRCFSQISVSQGLSRTNVSAESLLPVLNKYGLTLVGHRIVRIR